MQITIDTNNLSELDIAMLGFLADQGEPQEPDEDPAPVVETPKPKAAKAPKAEKPAEPVAETPAAEPEEEDLLGGEDVPTMSQAIAAATELVSTGGAAKVKAALAEIGVKRVSEMKDSDIPTFFAALAKADKE